MRRRRRVGLARMGRVPLVGRVVWGGGSAVQEVWGGEGEGGEDVCVYVVGTVPVAGSGVACTCCGEVASGGVVLGGGAPRRAVFEGR